MSADVSADVVPNRVTVYDEDESNDVKATKQSKMMVWVKVTFGLNDARCVAAIHQCGAQPTLSPHFWSLSCVGVGVGISGTPSRWPLVGLSHEPKVRIIFLNLSYWEASIAEYRTF